MKVNTFVALLGAGLALAAPTKTIDNRVPSVPQAYGPEHSVYRQSFKRHVPVESLADDVAGPLQSISYQPWKRHVPEIEERQEAYQAPEEPAGPIQSVSWVPFKRTVEEGVPEPEHYEVLTA